MNISNKRLAASLLTIIALLLIVTGCGGKNNSNNSSDATATGNGAASTQEASPMNGVDTSGDNPIVTIEMDSGKIIKVELYPKVAPNSVNNFISLVKKGFYDGTIFHRIIPGFMIQGGDPDGTGMGGPGYSIAGEFSQNGFENNLKHTAGVLSMARSQSPDSAGSQFFLMVADAPHLDGAYAAFGKVTEGMDVVNEIVQLPKGANDRPKTPPVMKKVTVDTRGVDAPEPEIIK
ncbi:peptidylprolyl isomerase [Cohnella lupini]|uniref:Peptidyl-prolyl cis-trans isomerase n=1 Tax=Cohnella lupini TaxID=1294267 RepID=A0A3D9IS34_9BACL|nr:peptidylprolyl isomerase [Cohnella lupini]RED64593.1 peptidyl-prolyl cis-trans isomerase B (cyclophilin B) [Cohnella lupini]